jgi:hypothetical protein
MELALNLIWVCVALSGCALLAVNLSRASGRPAGRPSNQQKIIAMSCALIILFFVISMTDDLHDQEILVEESKSLRVMTGTGSASLTTAHSATIPAFLLCFGLARTSRTSLSFALPSARRLLEPLEVSFTAAWCSRSLCGRAPPALPA